MPDKYLTSGNDYLISN